jgi:hypothetical protein
MRRTSGFDVHACAQCGGRLQLIPLIEPAVGSQRVCGT